eukprot:CAMPEP_0119271542 /NCGR_PEP_ID=MMETSP1329-20130426/8098_1 /TAXON_ID=114041 /ORGANISM="Genus nov. species nov., Strain RCC1024" /LENGTH=95 /DNA_ID=CAMNT_0007271591 /DNA_START=77 /DNA_END=361 /DNA_ORIENTATION=-
MAQQLMILSACWLAAHALAPTAQRRRPVSMSAGSCVVEEVALRRIEGSAFRALGGVKNAVHELVAVKGTRDGQPVSGICLVAPRATADPRVKRGD